MEQSPVVHKQQEESLAVEATTQEAIEYALDETQEKEKTTPPDETTRPENLQVNQNTNLLYEQCLGFIPGSLSGKRDSRYIYMQSFQKIIRNLILHMRTYCKFLRRPSSSNTWKSCRYQSQTKSIDVYFSTEDAAQFFVDRHIEIRGKRIPFIRKAKRILTVTINDIHTDLTDEELRSELYEYVANVSSIRHPGRNYKGMAFKDGYRQI